MKLDNGITEHDSPVGQSRRLSDNRSSIASIFSSGGGRQLPASYTRSVFGHTDYVRKLGAFHETMQEYLYFLPIHESWVFSTNLFWDSQIMTTTDQYLQIDH